MKSPPSTDKKPKWMRRTQFALGYVAAFCVIYPTLIVLSRFDDYYLFPNGAVLDRVFDWENWSRIDLLRTWDGELLVRDVYDVCFDRKAIKGTTVRSGSFVWLGGDAPLIRGGDANYDDVERASGLDPPGESCVGYFGSHLGAELLLFSSEFDWQRAKPNQKPRANLRTPERSTSTPRPTP